MQALNDLEYLWKMYLNSQSRKTRETDSEKTSAELRTPFERDFDRALFSAPFRRLADKTQVFPLESHDAVHTRLTHSFEVSNIARSLGTAIAYNANLKPFFEGISLTATRDIPSILATIGLIHDLGNPPFGHQGEKSIGIWFKKHFQNCSQLRPEQRKDFENFNGNAQTLRIITRLQILNDNFGLNLTYGTLAAAIKYPSKINKIGYFESEKQILDEIWLKTGLKQNMRHPLTYLMEASDDIAYSVIDLEDSVKKRLLSFSDILAHLEAKKKNPVIHAIVRQSKAKYLEYQHTMLTPHELNDISMQRFRTFVIAQMVKDVTQTFLTNFNLLSTGAYRPKSLIEESPSATLCQTLKDIAIAFSYNHRSVKKLELEGHNTILELMDMLWHGIEKPDASSFNQFAYSTISENYKRIFQDSQKLSPNDCHKYQLLSDMISGMTDNYCLNLHRELKALYRE